MTILVAAGASVLLIAVALLAYQSGCRSAGVRWPVALLDELRAHKLHCLEEQPERVALEIDLLCRADDSSEATRGGRGPQPFISRNR